MVRSVHLARSAPQVKVTLTDDEVTVTRVALRLAQTTYTDLMSMSPSREVRQMFMEAMRRLNAVDKKLGG